MHNQRRLRLTQQYQGTSLPPPQKSGAEEETKPFLNIPHPWQSVSLGVFIMEDTCALDEVGLFVFFRPVQISSLTSKRKAFSLFGFALLYVVICMLLSWFRGGFSVPLSRLLRGLMSRQGAVSRPTMFLLLHPVHTGGRTALGSASWGSLETDVSLETAAHKLCSMGISETL